MDKREFEKPDKVRTLAWLASTIDSLEDGKKYVLEVKEARKRRSLDANAYAWALLDQLAEVTHISQKELYREYVRNIGGNSEIVCVTQEAVDTLCRIWNSRGKGWQAVKMPSKISGCVNVTLYYGSSVYDTAQMSRLIDLIVQDCKTFGIPTLDDLELERLVSAWGGEDDGA